MQTLSKNTTDKTALREMQDKIGELPVLPQVLVKILQLDPASEDYFEEFGKLTKEDPAFAVRVIALANSAASAPAVPVASIRDALTRMGAEAIRSLVASLAVQRVFMPTAAHEVRLWQHSVFTAFAAAEIAEITPNLEVDPAEAYLVGLLHDIGRFVMFEHAAPNLLKVDESNWHTPEELVEADIKVYNFTHSELGYLACQHWKLPETIADVVRQHHAVLDEQISGGSIDATTLCVQVADRLCLSLLQRPDFDETDEQLRKEHILNDCLRTERERELISVATLVNNLDRISRDSKDLLSGLGFA